MSDDTKIKKDPNYYINWLEKAISEGRIKCYEYSDFENIKTIGSGAFGKVVRATLKDDGHCYALKSFFNPDKMTFKEVIHEV